MNLTPKKLLPWLAGTVIGLAATSDGITPAQLQQRLDAGTRTVIVDVRLHSLFQDGHIPGAINIPAKLAPEKQLPPLGLVVVYDDGLRENTAAAAAAALGQKPGITAEILDGGYAAWEAARLATTASAGVKTEAVPMITYAELQKEQDAGVVLVDLRQSPPSGTNAPSAKLSSEVAPAPALTDLRAEFPKATIVHSPFAVAAPKVAGGATPPLLVLIDNGDGRARAMARTLKANGIRRFVVLAGGEKVLAVHGQPGLERIGSSVNIHSGSAGGK